MQGQAPCRESLFVEIARLAPRPLQRVARAGQTAGSGMLTDGVAKPGCVLEALLAHRLLELGLEPRERVGRLTREPPVTLACQILAPTDQVHQFAAALGVFQLVVLPQE